MHLGPLPVHVCFTPDEVVQIWRQGQCQTLLQAEPCKDSVLCCWRGLNSLQSPLSLLLGTFYVVTRASKEFQLLAQATLGLTSHSDTVPDLIQFKLFSFFACPSFELATVGQNPFDSALLLSAQAHSFSPTPLLWERKRKQSCSWLAGQIRITMCCGLCRPD